MDNKKLQKTWEKFQKNKDKKQLKKLVEYYYENFVLKIAKSLEKRLRHKIAVEELASHGVSGLYKAIKSYDSFRGVKFETYAYSRIWGSMIDGLREEDRVPRSVRIRQAKIEKARHKLELKSGHKVSDQEAVQHAGFDIGEYYKNKSKFHATFGTSIETNTNDICTEDNKKDFNRYLTSNESPADSCILRKEFLNKLIGKDFTPFERKIIYYYYYEQLSMREIARDLNVSESRISQIHQSILVRLRNRIEVNPDYFDSNVLEIIESGKNKDSLL